MFKFSISRFNKAVSLAPLGIALGMGLALVLPLSGEANAQQIPQGNFTQNDFATVQSQSTANVRSQRQIGDAIAQRSSGGVIVQSGSRNTATNIIQRSPESNILQVQEGDENLAAAAIVGGSNNNILQSQIGNGKQSVVGLVNSVGTTVIHAQYNQRGQVTAAQATRQSSSRPIALSGLVLYNAPPGTIVILPK